MEETEKENELETQKTLQKVCAKPKFSLKKYKKNWDRCEDRFKSLKISEFYNKSKRFNNILLLLFKGFWSGVNRTFRKAGVIYVN